MTDAIEPGSNQADLARRLGLFDVAMIVMGGIIGSGIFINPYVVAQQVHSIPLILGAWAAGGLIALAGAYIYGELSSQTSLSGGQYVYLRDAFHPAIGFLYGWSLLLVIQSGGMAAVAVTFAKYCCEIVGIDANELIATGIAAVVLLALVMINCLGVRAGSTTQNLFMIMKLLAIAALVGFGLTIHRATPLAVGVPQYDGVAPVAAFGAALIPVFFAYGGWQTACFVAGEVNDPRKNLPRGLLLGVLGVIAIYLSVNFVCIHSLGPAGLAATTTPASAVMRFALGNIGGQIIAAGIAISTLGFLSQSMLTAPRVYFAMAEDGLFFERLTKLNFAQVPAFAIVLQGAVAVVIVFSGRYEQILNYVISVDALFFALTAACIFALRRRNPEPPQFQVPGHPVTTLLFIIACLAVVLSTVLRYPHHSLIGLGLMITGVPVFLFWQSRKRAGQ